MQWFDALPSPVTSHADRLAKAVDAMVSRSRAAGQGEGLRQQLVRPVEVTAADARRRNGRRPWLGLASVVAAAAIGAAGAWLYLRQALETTREDYRILEHTAGVAHLERQSASERAASAEADVERLRREVAKRDQDIQARDKEKDVQTAKLSAAEQAGEVLRKENDRLRSKVEELTSANSGQSEARAALNAALTRAERAEVRIEALEGDARDARVRILALQKEVEEAQSSLDASQQQAAHARQAIDNLNGEAERARAALSTFSTVYGSKTARLRVRNNSGVPMTMEYWWLQMDGTWHPAASALAQVINPGDEWVFDHPRAVVMRARLGARSFVVEPCLSGDERGFLYEIRSDGLLYPSHLH
jgi:hypothetical protein